MYTLLTIRIGTKVEIMPKGFHVRSRRCMQLKIGDENKPDSDWGVFPFWASPLAGSEGRLVFSQLMKAPMTATVQRSLAMRS